MKQCQSCGMPMNKDPEGGGTEADGSKSTTYCSICYENGRFKHETEDAREFQAMCMRAMRDNGMWTPIAWLFTRQIPNLGRWKA